MRIPSILLIAWVGAFMGGCATPGPPAQRNWTCEFPGMAKEYVFKSIEGGGLTIIVQFPPDWKPSDRRPGIVFFGGGGWNRQFTHQFAVHGAYLAGRGMVTARANYRVRSTHGVTPEVCVEDAKSAVRWFRANAKHLGLDPDRIVASGGSAGAHLAACTAATSGLEASDEDSSISSRPNALVLFNPALNFLGDRKEMLMQRLGSNDKKLAAELSPTLNLTADTPPALLLYGTEDFLLQQGREWTTKARRIGHASQLYLAKGQSHGFFNSSPWLERTLYRVDEFLASLGYLEGKPTVKEGQFADIKPSAGTNRQTAGNRSAY